MRSEQPFITDSLKELQKTLETARNEGLSIAVVPTMGALHDGHMSLISVAKSKANVVVSTIFVNPTQFNDSKDLEKYPRTEDSDIALLTKHGCDVIFFPTMEEVYPEGHAPLTIDYGILDDVMEGVSRPGHFDGVVEVVARLFQMVKPDMACFGEKDFQQLAVIQELVRQHGFPILILPCPISRDENGLARSSRNMRLTDQERKDATVLFETLQEMKGLTDVMNPDEVADWGRNRVKKTGTCELEYLEVADSATLRPIYRWRESENARAFIVAKFGEVRLIDNMSIYP